MFLPKLQKLICSFIFLHLISFAKGQSDFTLSFDFSPNISHVADNTGQSFYSDFAFNFLAHAELKSKNKTQLTFGTGFMQTEIYYLNYTGMHGFKDEENHFIQKFIPVMAGLKFNIGRFFIYPEAGTAIQIILKLKTFTIDEQGDHTDGPFSGFNTVPNGLDKLKLLSSLTAGTDLKLGSIKIRAGIRSYFILGTEIKSIRGAGAVIGLTL